jgi:hypothetical protein
VNAGRPIMAAPVAAAIIFSSSRRSITDSPP